MRIPLIFLFVNLSAWVFAAGPATNSGLRKQLHQLDTERAQRTALENGIHASALSSDFPLRKRAPPKVGRKKGRTPVARPAKGRGAAITKSKPLPQVKKAKGQGTLKKGAACRRKLHRRSIYDALVPRQAGPVLECDITLTLSTFVDGKTTTVRDVIPAGSPDLGALNMGNDGVYRISKWGTLTGSFIAKKLKNRDDMKKEADVLGLLCELIASSPEGSAEFWIVMKAVTGESLFETEEYKAAKTKPTAELNAFLKEKRGQLVEKVVKAYPKLKGEVHEQTSHGGKVHGDLYNKKEHVLWDKGKCNLIDWGRVWDDDEIAKRLTRWTGFSRYRNFTVAKKSDKDPEWSIKNVRTYAEICALSIYPDN